LTDAFAREAVDFIGRAKGDQPWFLYLSFGAVHEPMEATKKYESRFAGVTDPRRRTLLAMLAAMDDAIGQVMSRIRASGDEENTLVFFYSDNGGIPPKNASLNEPLRGQKGQMFEGGIRVPFLAKWKGTIPEGKVFRHPVMGFDVHASALAAAGVMPEPERPVDGVNLLPFVVGKHAGAPHQSLFWRSGRSHAVRKGNWKLVVQAPAAGPAMLFNLAEDIAEAKDLAVAHPDKLRELLQSYTEWDSQMIDPKWIRQDRFNAERGGKLKENPTRRPSPRRRNSVEEAFKRADKDSDGKLTRKEFPQPRVFDEVDTNNDGAATLDEVRAFYSKRRSAGRRDR
jgi:arylsulfatase A-like enzyme